MIDGCLVENSVEICQVENSVLSLAKAQTHVVLTFRRAIQFGPKMEIKVIAECAECAFSCLDATPSVKHFNVEEQVRSLLRNPKVTLSCLSYIKKFF